MGRRNSLAAFIQRGSLVSGLVIPIPFPFPLPIIYGWLITMRTFDFHRAFLRESPRVWFDLWNVTFNVPFIFVVVVTIGPNYTGAYGDAQDYKYTYAYDGPEVYTYFFA